MASDVALETYSYRLLLSFNASSAFLRLEISIPTHCISVPSLATQYITFPASSQRADHITGTILPSFRIHLVVMLVIRNSDRTLRLSVFVDFKSSATIISA